MSTTTTTAATATTTSINVLGNTIIRLSDLQKHKNGTRWDYLVAIPDDDDSILVGMWWTVGGICLLVAIFVSIVFLAILRSPLAMKFSFNVYLLALMIPDIVHTSQSTLVWWLAAARQGFPNATICRYQSWFVMFGLGGNSWVNAFIAGELWKMLRHSQRRRHYTPPTRTLVAKQAALIYTIIALLASVSLWPESKLPIRTNIQNGFICTPLDYDVTSAVVIYCIYFPMLVGIPVTFVLFVVFDVVFYSKLLPPQGKRRILTIYFFRMAFVFLFMWIPNSFVNYFFPRTPSTLKWAITGWSHFQGLVAAASSLHKPDIAQAVREFLGVCQPQRISTDGSTTDPNRNGRLFQLLQKKSSRWIIWDQDIASDENKTTKGSSPIIPGDHRGSVCDNRTTDISGTMNGDEILADPCSRWIIWDPDAAVIDAKVPTAGSSSSIPGEHNDSGHGINTSTGLSGTMNSGGDLVDSSFVSNSNDMPFEELEIEQCRE